MTIDGTVDGDVEVWADKLILGKNAHITGTVNAHISEDPERAEALRSAPSRSTVPRTRAPLRLTTPSAASSPRRFLPALSRSSSSLSFRARRQRRRNASPTTHPAVGERSFGHDCYRPRRPTADYLHRWSIACRSLMCGVIGIALVSNAFAGCAIARMVGHSQNRYAMAAVGGIAAGASQASPRRRLHQRRGLCLYARLHHPDHLRNARLKPQQPTNTPGLPTA